MKELQKELEFKILQKNLDILEKNDYVEVRTINSSRNVIMNRGEIYLTRSQTVQTVTEEYTFERAQRPGSSHLTAQC